MNQLSAFIKYQRKQLGLNQEELATKAGVGIRFIREMEQGKETLQLDKVDQVLNLFGFQLTPEKIKIDAYDIFWNYFNKAVKITMTNKLTKYGFIINQKIDKKENKIIAWEFIANPKALTYQQNLEDGLTETILHEDIDKIEYQ